MIKSAGVLAVVLVFSALSFSEHTTLPQLIARADAARTDQQPKLYMEIAGHEMKLADAARKADKSQDFVAALDNVVKYSGKAHTAAITSNKELKKTEIRIRKISSHLQDIQFDVDPDLQGGVQRAIDKLESFRTDLLQKMFAGKNK